MGLFDNLLGKIYSYAESVIGVVVPPPAPANVANPPAGAVTAPATPAPTPVDVTAILDGLAAKSSEELDWKHSIVDLLKLVNEDSSLTARKALAHELGYTGDPHDSATMNIWLHKAVLQKIAECGGKIPDHLTK
jgi:hypothetical protein